MESATAQEIPFGNSPKAPSIAPLKLSSITAQVLKTLERWTFYCDSVEYKRKDKPAAWSKHTNKPSETMFKSYPDFSFIPGTKGDELPIMYGDFWIDIDTKEQAIDDAKKIIAYFDETHGVDADEWGIFLSGKKGVHLSLSESVFGIEAGHKSLTSGYKRLAHDIQGDLGISLDLSLYQKGTGKPFRQPNILRPDTQTYKVQIEFDSENEDTPGLSNITDDYIEICSKPRETWTPEAKYNDDLSKLLKEFLDEAGKETKAIPIDATQAKLLSEDFPPCLRFLAKNTEMSPKNANFNDVAIQLTSSFISAGKTESEFLELCQNFIAGYPTTSLKNDLDRLRNAKNRFRNALSNDYQHSCGGILSLGFSSKDFNCDDCRLKIKVEQEVMPTPTPLPECLRPVMPLKAEMIPESLRPWIMDVSDRMQIPPDFVAVAVIVAAGSVIGRQCGIYPKQYDNWLEVPNVWGGVIGRPSTLKSPTIAEGQSPLLRLEKEFEEKHSSDKRDFDTEKEIIKIKKAGILEAIKKTMTDPKMVDPKKKSEVELLTSQLKDLQEKESEPVRKRFKTNDATVEKIGELLIQNPTGLLVTRDELSGWLNALNKPGREGDSSFYLESWNGTGGMYTYDRIGRGTIDIPSLCLSVFGAMTPGTLGNYVYAANKGGKGDDGLLQRFQLLVWPEIPEDFVMIDKKPDAEAKEKVCNIFKNLSGGIPGAISENGSSIPALRFSPEAQEIFNAFYINLEHRVRERDSELSEAFISHKGKFRSLMPNLALIFHLLENSDCLAVGKVSVEAALLAVEWCKYLETHALKIYNSAIEPGMESAREILKHIKKGEIKNGDSVRSICRGRHWTHLSSTDEVKAGLEILQEYNYLKIEQKKTTGRPSEILRLNPIL